MKSILRYILFSLLVFITFTACVIGLGEAVDMQAPVVTLTSHKDNDSVAATFVLRGTASDNQTVAKLEIDFDDADLHYKVIPGGNWQKKTASTVDWVYIDSDSNNYCTLTNKVWNWSVNIDTSEQSASKTGSNYTLTVVVVDEFGNSGKTSKTECSLVVDSLSPDVSVIQPELLTGDYRSESYVENKFTLTKDTGFTDYSLQDGNVIARLLNGDIYLKGRQSGSVSFKELLIEFDDGKLPSGTRKSTNDAPAISSMEELLNLDDPINGDAKLGDVTPPTVYFTKYASAVGGEDLREWECSISANEWITDSKNQELKTGPHLIRVISTSLSSSNAWERKVLGYFIWWPEADKPWLTINTGNMGNGATELDNVHPKNNAPVTIDSECYPGGSISGSAQDDDGIKEILYKLYKLNKETNDYEVYPKTTESDEEKQYKKLPVNGTPSYSAWNVSVPSENGTYCLQLEVRDVKNNSYKILRWFKTSDVSAPRFYTSEDKIKDTESGVVSQKTVLGAYNGDAITDSAIINSTGDITFKGTVTDDGKIDHVVLVWLNPALRNSADNKVGFLTAAYNAGWDTVDNTTKKRIDANGNILFNIYKYESGTPLTTYNILKTINLFTDLGVGEKDSKGNLKSLTTQEFVFYVSDSSSSDPSSAGYATSVPVNLSGDSITPELSISDITISRNKQSFADNNIPVFPKAKASEKATIEGAWSDKFTSSIANTSKVYKVELSWGSENKTSAEVTPGANGKWTANIDIPAGGGTITAKLKDYGGNERTVQAVANIETSELGLSRIDCDEVDGAYSAGSTLNIRLEFTKDTKVTFTGDENKPTLTLNNGGIAIYKGSSDTKSSSHVFEYVIDSSDGDTTEAAPLTVTSINTSNAVWTDAAVGGNADDLTSKVKVEEILGTNLGASRKIIIDNTAPKVKSITALSSEGYYKYNSTSSKGDEIMFMLEFDEDVTLYNGAVKLSNDISSYLALQFDHKIGVNNAKTTKASVSGTKYVLFTHQVAASENTSELKFDSFVSTGLTVKDSAGNSLTNWTPKETPVFKKNSSSIGFVIDTSVPSAPVINFEINPTAVVLSESGVSFTITGESDATFEYSIDNGSNWVPYSSKVTLINDDDYNLTARQTDKAGNVSVKSTPVSFKISKGDLFKRITATTFNGTYSENTSTKVINGRIEFRDNVTIPKDTIVTLNVKNRNGTPARATGESYSNGYVTCAIQECKTSAGTASTFTFNYTIQAGDYIESNAKLNVTSLGFSSVTYSGQSVTITPAKSFNEMKSIYIDTLVPAIKTKTAGGLEVNLSTDGSKLQILFNKEVSKVNDKEIIFTYVIPTNNTGDNQFHVPTVLTSSEFNELITQAKKLTNKTLTTNSKTVQAYLEECYVKGTNGASKNADNTLTQDTSTKYILDFAKSDTDAGLVEVFTTKLQKHIVIVPVVSDSVKIVADTNDSNKKTILEVDLSSTYALPVKGAQYSVTLPAGLVTDSVKNVNAAPATSPTINSVGVEVPKIRIEKGKYTIKGNKGDTTSAYADQTTAQTAKIRIDCRTPGATITHKEILKESIAVVVNEGPKYFETKTGDVIVSMPTDTDTYTANSEITLASGDDYKVDSCANAKGLKFAIAVTAKKGSASESSYEAANRTVLKFTPKSNRGEYGISANGDTTTSIVEGRTTRTFKDLKVWVIGGDAAYGDNTLDPFPLSWADSSNFKLMNGKFANNTMIADFYWVTWDISAATYHGFAIGDVPTDVETAGPKTWYVGECAWVAAKENYVLYPGETLEMTLDGTHHVLNSFLFRDKNKGTR